MSGIIWPYLPAFLALIGSVGFGALMKTLLDFIRGKKQDEMGAAMELIETLRQQLATQSKRIDKLEGLMVVKDQIAEMKQSILRHKLANMRTIFAGLMMALRKATVETLPDIINLIEEMRARHEAEEQAEEARIAEAMTAAVAVLGSLSATESSE